MRSVKTLNKPLVTIDDVAKLAKVSTATISRAINKPEIVSDKLKRKIDTVIKKSGYIPNAGARTLMLKKSGSIGAIVPTLDNAIFAQGLSEFQRQLSKSGYQMLVASTNYDPETESNQIRNLLLQGVEGIAMFGASQKRDALKLLKTRQLPYIHVGTLDVPLNGFASGYDNKKVIQLGTQYLINQGHKRFGMIAGITQNNDRATDRVIGVIQILKQHGINLKKELIIEVPYQINDARQALQTLLKNDPKITAIICGQDILAIGALLEAQSLKITVPDQISIIGFDDLEICRHMQPSLSSIHLDSVAMWSKAADHLIAQINGAEKIPKKILVDANLVIRNSTAKPRKTNNLFISSK
jgi:LacI family transcriptional regulator